MYLEKEIIKIQNFISNISDNDKEIMTTKAGLLFILILLSSQFFFNIFYINELFFSFYALTISYSYYKTIDFNTSFIWFITGSIWFSYWLFI